MTSTRFGRHSRPTKPTPGRGPTVFLVALAAAMLFSIPASSRAGTVSPNPIQAENALPGTTSWKRTSPDWGSQIAGYPSAESVFPGQTVNFMVSTSYKLYSAQIFRIGWYQGKGGRLVYSQKGLVGRHYKTPAANPTTGVVICDWPIAFSVVVPSAWVTGFYLVKLSGKGGSQSYIPFVVKEPEDTTSPSPLLMLDETGTSEAYNLWGGASLFSNLHYSAWAQQFAHRAVEVSFLRPFTENFGAGWFLSWEIHTVRWLEENGYDVSYASELDVQAGTVNLLDRKGIIIAGHDEYWSANIRDGMDAAVAAGVNFANLAANTGYWQSRFQAVGDDPTAIEICYKDFDRDPEHLVDPKLTTVTWRSPQVNQPEGELTGAMYGDFEGSHGPYPWKVTNTSSWIFEHTGIKPGLTVPGIVGQEDDTILKQYPRPADVQVVSASPILNNVGQHRVGNTTIYRAPSGAWVFDASAIEWGFGLDDLRLPGPVSYEPARKIPSPAIEAVTANVLNAFLASPGGS